MIVVNVLICHCEHVNMLLLATVNKYNLTELLAKTLSVILFFV